MSNLRRIVGEATSSTPRTLINDLVPSQRELSVESLKAIVGGDGGNRIKADKLVVKGGCGEKGTVNHEKKTCD